MSAARLSPLLKFNAAHIAAVILLDVLWGYFAGFSMVWSSTLMPLAICCLLGGLAYVYTTKRPEPGIAAVGMWSAVLIAYTAAGAMLSYLSISMNFPARDAVFAAWDTAIGFHWPDMLHFVLDRPWLWLVWKVFYNVTLPLVSLTIVFLALTNRIVRLETFVTALLLCATATMLISGYFAAIGPYIHFDAREASAAYAPTIYIAETGNDYLDTLRALRDGSLRTLSLSDAKGIVSLPSFHAIMATLMILAFWGSGRMAWVMVPVNVMTLVATPVDGGHYLVDVIVGVSFATAMWFAILRRQAVVAWARELWPRITQLPQTTP